MGARVDQSGRISALINYAAAVSLEPRNPSAVLDAWGALDRQDCLKIQERWTEKTDVICAQNVLTFLMMAR
jgi:hypothetical protein